MKLSKSTAFLIALWIATFVLYVFVKPSQAQPAGYVPIKDTIPGLVTSATMTH
ncbi:hypothetical protein [Nocardia stercoris]|uniref:hypothetical protein n=1 Tax=Nocardia stercoris TaxID=2483361 RepID=UPI00131A363A|nr:hypothetical protein [Nocardia stercoris]